MIVSASRRTDIPCHYAEWLIHRLCAGYCETRNPMNNAQVSRIPLTPDEVDCIVFWTKDPVNIIPHLPEIDSMGFNYYFQFSLTPYGSDLEQSLRDKGAIADTFAELSGVIGKHRIIWRYDPIAINDAYTIDYHKRQFAHYCERLSPHTESVTISYVDKYAKIKSPLIREATEEEVAELSRFIAETARAYGIAANACCEQGLSAYGISQARCIDKSLVERICARTLNLPKDKNQRPNCGCAKSTDIGAYNTCTNGCIYCYANNGANGAIRRKSKHNPNSPSLIDTQS